jgi:hypothetical protein
MAMPRLTPRLRLSVNGNVTIIELLDRKILDGVNILQIGEQLAALVTQAGEPKFVLDFSNVGHLSSSALGILITLAESNEGSVTRHGVQKTLTDADKERLAAAQGVATEILCRLGAKEEELFLGTINAGHPGGSLPLTDYPLVIVEKQEIVIGNEANPKGLP